jgi:prepilin-type N-terminal cleavage/methylation domain-containing protein
VWKETRTILATGNDKRRAGFTLIELSIAVFVIALLLAIGAPSFVRSYNSALLNETARSFATTCQLARIQAITQQRNATLHVDLDRQVFWITQPLKNEYGETSEQTIKVFRLSQRVALVSAERADATKNEKVVDIDFYPNGTCDAFTVVFRGSERGGLAAMVDPITCQAALVPVK